MIVRTVQYLKMLLHILLRVIIKNYDADDVADGIFFYLWRIICNIWVVDCTP